MPVYAKKKYSFYNYIECLTNERCFVATAFKVHRSRVSVSAMDRLGFLCLLYNIHPSKICEKLAKHTKLDVYGFMYWTRITY